MMSVSTKVSTLQSQRPHPGLQHAFLAYNHAQAVTSEAATKILDARLALTRLRAAHLAPRLTLAAATQIADKQEEMVTTDATLLDLNEPAAEVKNHVKARV